MRIASATRLAVFLLMPLGAHAAPRLLLCTAEVTGTTPDLQKKLTATGAFAVVDALDCKMNTPTLAALKMYDAALVFDDPGGGWKDPVGLGTNLADFVDGGGGVVTTTFASAAAGNMIQPGLTLGGRWSGAYECYLPAPANVGAGNFFPFKAQPNEPQSPIVQGVGGVSALFRGAPTMLNQAKGAVSVWDYMDGSSAICRMTVAGHPRVDINFYPGSTLMGMDFYKETKPGDVVTLLKNALLYASGGGSALRGMPDPVNFADTGTGAISPVQTVTFTNSSMMQVSATAVTILGANAGDFVIEKAPALPLALVGGATLAVDVAFQPTGAGPRSATLQIAVAGMAAPASVSLAGKGIGSQVVVMPSPVAIGSQVGVPVNKMLTVANLGMGKVSVANVAVTMGQASFKLSNVPGFPIQLAGGTNFGFTLTFTPAMNGATPGILTVTSNDPLTPVLNVALDGTAGPPAIALDVGSLVFGDVNLGATSASSTVTVTNSGFSDLNVTNLAIGGGNPGDFLLAKGRFPELLGPGASDTFAVSFKPLAIGPRAATVTVSSNAGNKVVSLSGNGTSTVMKVAPLALTFPPTRVGQAAPVQNLAITSMGSGKLRVMGLTFGGPGAASFASTAMPPFDVPANQTAMAGVTCTPQALGPIAATLTIGADVGNAQVSLSCTGAAPRLSIAPNALDFGPVTVAATAPAQQVVVTNVGTLPLLVQAGGIAGPDAQDFAVQNPPMLPSMLMPKGSLKIGITFAPSRSGAEVAQIDLSTDDPMMPNATVKLSGSGVQPGASADPPELDFMSLAVGASLALPVTVANTGDGMLSFPDPALTGSPGFTIAPVGAFTVDTGQSKTFMVRFSPTLVGAATGSLTFAPSGGLAKLAVVLKGTGLSPDLAVMPLSLDFGSAAIGGGCDGRVPPPQVVTLRNGGATPIQLEPIAMPANAQFAVDSSQTGATLAPGAMTTFSVSFKPGMVGQFMTELPITLKGQHQPVAQVTLSGVGVDARCPTGCHCAIGSRGARPGPVWFATIVLAALLFLRARARTRPTMTKG